MLLIVLVEKIIRNRMMMRRRTSLEDEISIERRRRELSIEEHTSKC